MWKGLWTDRSGYERAILVCTVALLVVALLTWAEQSTWLPRVLSGIPFGSLFMMLVALGFLLGLKTMYRLSDDRRADLKETTDKLAAFVTGEHGLARAHVRLNLHETRLNNVDKSLLDQIAADCAPDRRRVVFNQIDNLSAIKQAALFDRHPEVLEWYAAIESAAISPEGIPHDEVVFTEPDGRAWTFGELSDMGSQEQEALREAKPRVWSAYRGRLFRDVVFPPAQEGTLRPRREANSNAPPQDFVALGAELLMRLRSVESNDAVRLVMEQEFRWEYNVCEWLKDRDPKAVEIFMSEFPVSQAADLRNTLIIRVETRLERLKNILLRLGG